jgi:hypothetical protein
MRVGELHMMAWCWLYVCLELNLDMHTLLLKTAACAVMLLNSSVTALS